jgi:hypothetical protein
VTSHLLIKVEVDMPCAVTSSTVVNIAFFSVAPDFNLDSFFFFLGTFSHFFPILRF